MMGSFLCIYLIKCSIANIIARINGQYTQYPGSFPLGFDYKESACNTGDLDSIPGRGRLGNGYPLQYICLENSVDRGPNRLQSMGSQESNMTEQLVLSLFSYIVFYSRILAYFSYSLYPIYFTHEFCSLLYPQCFSIYFLIK